MVSVIVTRTPLRVTLAGGGTDLPSYYSEHGGLVISAAIDKHVHIIVNRPALGDGYALRYSEAEHVESPADIKHPILREALVKEPPGLELACVADVPAGTGLGSSGAFTVGVLHALHPKMSTRWLAEEACALEINRLGRTVGDQDAYIAAYGGVQVLTFHPSGAVNVTPLEVGPLSERLCLFFLGTTRNAADVLGPQADNVANLHETKAVGAAMGEALTLGDLDAYGRLLGEHWEIKKRRAPGISDARIDALYQQGLDAGALGGKVCGAGGGGFLCFYTRNPEPLRAALNLPELTFGFDYHGSTCMS